MGTLTGALSASTRSLSALEQALAVAQTNISNIGTPHYARARAVLSPAVLPHSATQPGIGVDVIATEELRDRFLEVQVLGARQQTSLFDKTKRILDQIEVSFPVADEGTVGHSLDDFFASFSRLSVNPAEFSLRAEVMRSAQVLSSAFRTTNEDLAAHSQQLESEATAKIAKINTLLNEISQLQANRLNVLGDVNLSNETRLSQVYNDLSELIDFSILQQSDGTISIMADGAPLLVGKTLFPITVSTTNQGLVLHGANGRDITADIEGQGGELGAILQVRNQTIPRIQSELNRLVKSLADHVNEQLALGVDLTGSPGRPLFEYATSYYTGSGRTPGITGDDPPVPPVSVRMDFTNGVTASLTATLNSFFAAAAAPAGPAAGNTVSVTFTSADGEIQRTITTDPILAGGTTAETTAEIRDRLNDQINIDPGLAGLVQFSVATDGELKLVLSDAAKQGFTFTSSTSNSAFTTGLEPGGSLGGHSAEEIAFALNAAAATQAAVDPDFAAAHIRFSVAGGELRVDGDDAFDFQVTDTASGTGFASGLDDGALHHAGGAPAASTIRVADLSFSQIAAGTPLSPSGNANALEIAKLGEQVTLDGFTFIGFYGNMITELGNEGLSAQLNLEAKQQVLDTTEQLRESYSGVNLNEEAVKLVDLQRAYQSMLRVIQIVDSMREDVIGLLRP